jgi:NTP pyrophosphatase (non-canonical NTP hydrolase)
MELKALEEAMQAFVEGKGWYKPDSPHPQTPKNLAISLVLEANEVLEHFQWGETASDKSELAGELADVLLYLLQIARLHDINLGQAVKDKLDINASRDWD